jgi:hypothetical protein
MSGGKSERDRPGFAGMMIRTISAALIVELLAGGTIYFNKDGYAIAVGVADQIETTTEPGASRKGFAGAHEINCGLGMLEESSRVRALYAHSQDSSGLGVPKTRRSLPEPLVRRQTPFGQRRFPASPRSLEESIARRVGFP